MKALAAMLHDRRSSARFSMLQTASHKHTLRSCFKLPFNPETFVLPLPASFLAVVRPAERPARP